MLAFLLFIPLFGALLVAVTPTNNFAKSSTSEETVSLNKMDGTLQETMHSSNLQKKIALFASLLTFFVSILMWGEFDSSCSGYQFTSSLLDYRQTVLASHTPNFASLPKVDKQTGVSLGIDGLSLYFVLLTTFTMPIALLAAWNNIKHDIKFFYICFLVLESLLIAVFTVMDLLLFYIFFESVLIPLFLIVGIWGASANRVRASFLLFLYTLFGSLFMLLGFLALYYYVGSTDFQVLFAQDIGMSGADKFDLEFSQQTNNTPLVYRPDQIAYTSHEKDIAYATETALKGQQEYTGYKDGIQIRAQKYIWLSIFLSFAIKTPLLPFHIWLSRAHVESPLAGSMVLAGLILKLAVYGFLRILIPMLPEATAYFSPFVQTIAVLTLIYSSLTTLRQTDFKCLVAYSSVAHMSVVVIGLFSNTIQGISGGIFLSLAHGFVSPALFMLVGGVLYDRYHTRTIRYYRGMTTTMPLFSIFFFLFVLGNMATPTTANWIGEFLCLTGALQKNSIIGVIMSSTIVLSAAYSIWLYNRVAFGQYSKYISLAAPIFDKLDPQPGTDVNRRECVVLISLLIPTFFFGIWPSIILADINYSVSTLLYSPAL